MNKIHKFVLAGGAAIIAAMLLAVVLPATILRAETETATPSGEEDVVASPTDQPLARQAKLKRAWVVYREMDSKDIYAITKDKKKRLIQTLDFFTAFNANYHIKVVKPGRLANFTTGDPITTITGLNPDDFMKAGWGWRLVKVKGKPAVYLITPDGKRRLVIAAGVFHRFGWEFRDVEEVPESEVNALPEDSAVTDNTVFEEEVNVGTTRKRLQREQLEKRLELKGKKVLRVRLVKAIGDPNIYIIDAKGRKHRIASEAAARKRNLNLREVTEVTEEELEAFPNAEEITETQLPVNLNESVD